MNQSLTQQDLIHCWRMYAKYNEPHPCRMPSPEAEAGRLLIVYKEKALQYVMSQVKHTNFSNQVCYLLQAAAVVGFEKPKVVSKPKLKNRC